LRPRIREPEQQHHERGDRENGCCSHRQGIAFAGIVYGSPQRMSVGACIRDLELVAKVSQPEELANQVLYLPF
jgi:hypothetical protein